MATNFYRKSLTKVLRTMVHMLIERKVLHLAYLWCLRCFDPVRPPFFPFFLFFVALSMDR